MPLTLDDAIARLKSNEERVDVWANQPGPYTTNEAVPRQIESIPTLMARLQDRYLTLVSRGNWATATVYAINDLVFEGGFNYLCTVGHTSGVFATDLAANKWVLYNGVVFTTSTLTELKNSSTTLPLAVFAMGRTTAGDGYQGWFQWRTGNFTTQAAADPAEAIYVASNSVAISAGAWVRQYFGAVLPQWFGAVGDGVTNDRVAINRAIAIGKSVFFPNSEYLVSGGNIILANSGQHIFGEGWGSKITGGDGVGLIDVGASDGVTISDLWLNCTSDGYGAITCFHVNITNLTIERNKLTTTTGTGANGIKLVTDNATTGINGVTIRYNYIPSPRQMGIEIQSAATLKYRNVRILNNWITDTGQAASYGQGISLTGPGEYCDVIGNVIERATGYGIENVGCSYATITDNKIIDIVGARPLVTANSLLMTGCVIARNLVKGGTPLDCFFASLAYSIIRDNLFDFGSSANGHINLANSGPVAGCGWNRVERNTVITAATSAFVADKIGNNTIVDNYFDNSACAGNYSTMRFYGAGSMYNYAARNQLRIGTGGAWLDEANGAANNAFDNNIYRSGTLALSNLKGGEKAGSITYDPPSIAAGASVYTTVTVTGAAVNDFAIASFSIDLAGLMISAQVTAANTVGVRFFNPTAGAIDLGSGTLRVRSMSYLSA